MMDKNKKQGFTFIELLVVVTIIAVLAAIGAVSYRSTNQNARDSKRLADLEQIRSALEICRSEVGYYPSSISGGVSCGGEDYLSPLPSDPQGGGYSYSPSGCSAGQCTSYEVCTTLEDDSNCNGTIVSGECCLSNP